MNGRDPKRPHEGDSPSEHIGRVWGDRFVLLVVATDHDGAQLERLAEELSWLQKNQPSVKPVVLINTLDASAVRRRDLVYETAIDPVTWKAYEFPVDSYDRYLQIRVSEMTRIYGPDQTVFPAPGEKLSRLDLPSNSRRRRMGVLPVRFGRLRLAIVLASSLAIGIVWILAEGGSPGLSAAVQTAVILAFVLFVAYIQHAETRRLARKVGTIRKRVSERETDRELVSLLAGMGKMPQEQFEQLARVLAANNQRLESAIDDLSRRLENQI